MDIPNEHMYLNIQSYSTSERKYATFVFLGYAFSSYISVFDPFCV